MMNLNKLELIWKEDYERGNWRNWGLWKDRKMSLRGFTYMQLMLRGIVVTVIVFIIYTLKFTLMPLNKEFCMQFFNAIINAENPPVYGMFVAIWGMGFVTGVMMWALLLALELIAKDIMKWRKIRVEER
jgi:hypothetical protein